MQFLAIILVLVSAIIHAGWNLFSQKRQVTPTFFFFACLAAAIILSPLLWVFRAAYSHLSADFWIPVILSGVFEAIYYVSLCGAYRRGDLSMAYPLIRAVPVLMVALVSLVRGDGNPPTGWGLVGVLLVGLGCLLLPLKSFRRQGWTDYLSLTNLLALGAGVGTTGYTLADNRAMLLLSGISTNTLPTGTAAWFFLALKTLSSSLALGAVLILFHSQRNDLATFHQTGLKGAMVTGLFIFGAYGLVLAAMAIAGNVSYVIAFRQLSIPIGAGLAVWINKEHLLPPRLTGIGVITLGCMLVALG